MDNKQLNQQYYNLIREDYTGYSNLKLSEIEKQLAKWAYATLQLKQIREEIKSDERKDN